MSFKDIKGQDRPIQILKGYLKSQALRGAYLFIGQEGVGKHLVAVNFAKAINCLEAKVDACDRCPSCLKIDKNQHPDVHLIGLFDSDNIKIEAIRELKRNINFKAYEARKKVFIINDAHNLSEEAQGAILKILEEPPGDSLIILISAKPALLFKTTISRCKIIKFCSLKRSELKEVFTKDYHLQDNPAHFLAYFAEGRIGKALRLKDTGILEEKNRIIDEFAIQSEPSLGGNLSRQDRDNVRSWLNILAAWFRDIYLIKAGMNSSSELINLDRKEELLESGGRYTLFELDAILKSISDSLLYLEQNVNIKLLLSNLRAELHRK
ncbi:MAG: hypothetical protein KKH29_03505 [Candidatus Omnitrophica bacterium]|nr:hypothetical protein [Candidatus Omnitrophota bacterium]MBU4473104.1 hypothetical protein [Candidatus Omnitrophota bacterium]MCG2706863.1 hypothetical protein [Candidatus Omnitrophota bacterium]